jgi:hypothetical protein
MVDIAFFADANKYEANAIDADGERVRVQWDIANPDAELSEDACDWDSPSGVRQC